MLALPDSLPASYNQAFIPEQTSVEMTGSTTGLKSLQLLLNSKQSPITAYWQAAASFHCCRC